MGSERGVWNPGWWSESAPGYRWHCLCTLHDDRLAWGNHKHECWTCGTYQPTTLASLTRPPSPEQPK